MSLSENDIAAAFDDIEVDTLMSLLQDDCMFQDLNQLQLPSLTSESLIQDSHVIQIDDDMVLDENEFDDFLEFHDALESLPPVPIDTSKQLVVPVLDPKDSIPDPITSVPNHNMSCDPSLSNELTDSVLLLTDISANKQVPYLFNENPLNSYITQVLKDTHIESTGSLSNGNEVVNNGLLNSTGLLPVQHSFSCDATELITRQSNVCHDHTYAFNGSSDGSMLTPLHRDMSNPVLCDNSGRSSDNEEGNTSDAGYDTMTTSPASTRSSYSSTTHHSISQHLNSPPAPTTSPPQKNLTQLTQLLPDPVKLIDERIKFFMSRQQVHLTEEEKETLKAEGLPIPTTLPLTKVEEKALKTVRRKIRNKFAAQESRKKKKEYLQTLEEKVQHCTKENLKLHKKVENLETENRTLLQQLRQLQALVARTNPIFGRPAHLGTCLMVVVLCFGVLFGNLLPYKVSLTSNTDYSTATVRSRSLLSLDTSQQPIKWMNWIEFYKSILPGGENMNTLIDSTHKDNFDEPNNYVTSFWFHSNVSSSNNQTTLILSKA